jgi:hypothetical protein
MIKKHVLYMFMLLLFFCSYSISNENKKFEINEHLTNNVKVAVVIDIANDIEGIDKKIVWGARIGGDDSYIKKILVSLDGTPSWVRFSAYSDLKNLQSVRLNISENNFQIIIEGGESSAHYIAKLTFDNNGYLISRRVYNPAFSDEVWEETHYSYIKRLDM